MTARRSGTTLVELLVTLPLAALVLALVAAALLSGWRAARQHDHAARHRRELRHAAGALAAELRPLATDAVLHWSDTLLTLRASMGTAIVCHHPAPATVVVLAPPGSSTGVPWRTPPAAGDALQGWTLATDLHTPQPLHATVEAVEGGTACPPSPAAPRGAGAIAWRLTLQRPSPLAFVPGLPLHVTRLVRYRLYASQGGWFLGRQTFTRGAWEGLQPLAGPLESPTARGMRVQGWDAAGIALASGGAALQHVRVTLRTPAGPSGRQAPLPPYALHATVSLRRRTP
jgi:hypothetical protein